VVLLVLTATIINAWQGKISVEDWFGTAVLKKTYD